MKRISIFLSLICLIACSDDGIYSGSDTGYAPSEYYLVSVSQNLIPDFLIGLEKALNYDGYGYYDSMVSADFETEGKTITVPGNSWIVNAVASLPGMTITCLSEDTWKLSWEGDDYVSLPTGSDEHKYFTACTVTAKLIAETARYHYDWDVKFTGRRTEFDGYACDFWSAPNLIYTSSVKSYIWDSCDGSAIIEVAKDGVRKEYARMDFIGSSHRFFRGLQAADD